MKGLRILARRNTKRRILLWLPCLLFCWWSLSFLAREWRAERERALYGGLSIHEWLDQALAEDYYSSHWTTLADPAEGRFDRQVIAIGAPAVPELVKRLRKLHTGAFHRWLIALRHKLPSADSDAWPEYFDSPRDVSADVAHINYILSKMGEAARPAVPAMLESSREMHIWAYYCLMDDLVRLGTVAREALPTLRKWAQEGSEDAALAIKFIEQGRTELQWSDIEEPTNEVKDAAERLEADLPQ